MTEFLIAMGVLTYAVIGGLLGVLNLIEVRKYVRRRGIAMGIGQTTRVLLRVGAVVCFWPVVMALAAIGIALGGRTDA